MRDMVALYVEQMPERLAAARTAVARGDVKAFARAAHAIKSSSAQLGATRLTALLQETEDVAERGATIDAPHHLAEIEREYAEFRERLHAASRPGARHHAAETRERSE